MMSRPSLILPEVIDCTSREAELPAFVTLGAHAHGIGWRHLVRLVFALPGHGSRVTRPAIRPIVVDVGGRTTAQRREALAREFAGGGVTQVEIFAVRQLSDGLSPVTRDQLPEAGEAL